MKNTILWATLCTIMCTQVHADDTQNPNTAQTPETTPTVVSPSNPNVEQNNPAPTTTQQNQPMQQNNQTIPQTNTTQQQPMQPSNDTTPQTTQPIPAIQVNPVIDCDYKFPNNVKTIDQTTIITWAEKATTQAFDFDPNTIDAQMTKLHSCFTDQGWIGFTTALEKSGNLDAIKNQKLNVSSQVDGKTEVTEAQNSQWKITLPLQVVYQNDKEKVTQLLTVNLIVGRKNTGDLGITQMIATPRSNAAEQPAQTTTPSSTNSNNPVNPAASNPVNPDTSNPVSNTTQQSPDNTSNNNQTVTH